MSTTAALSTEYQAITEACGLLDRSDRGKLALSGAEAKSFLQGQVTNDIEALVEGAGCYAAFLTPKGKMLGDLRVLDTGGELLLDTERSALQALFNMIRRFSVGYNTELHKRTVQRGLLSLIGPSADALLADSGPEPTEHAHRPGIVGAVSARAIRTDIGIDLLCDAADTETLAELLVERGALPVSEGATEIVRVERGRPRYGVDLDESVIPQEAGLNERAVSFTKGCYVGQETVARLYYRGKPNRHLRGLRSDGPLSAGQELRLDGRVVGRVTSAVSSPRLGAIALGLVRREAPPGSRVTVVDSGRDAAVVELPFAAE
ncbi:MAG: folate-binding protein [Actinomycetota bacterium]|nr:folate-binding protein [Actinomycetota bacterium]